MKDLYFDIEKMYKDYVYNQLAADFYNDERVMTLSSFIDELEYNISLIFKKISFEIHFGSRTTYDNTRCIIVSAERATITCYHVQQAGTNFEFSDMSYFKPPNKNYEHKVKITQELYNILVTDYKNEWKSYEN